MKEKLLHLIGLERARNLDVLLDELAGLTPEAFERLLLTGSNDLEIHLDQLMCADCKAGHGGKCPHPDDADLPCEPRLADWLALPCTRDRLLPEGVGS